MDIKDLTIREVEELQKYFSNNSVQTNNNLDNEFVGKKVLVRTYSAGVHFGTIEKKVGDEIILKNSRRLWTWYTNGGISLSDVAINGINQEKSRIATKVDRIWLQPIEIIEMTNKAIKTIEEVKEDEAR